MPLRIFPVAGNASFTNDWAEPRSGGRRHLGNDLFAPLNTPLIAVDDGEIRFGTDPLGGNIANLYATDGTRYYYAHLSSFAGVSRRRVRTGEVIGYLGNTGNAIGTRPHVHFEVHPEGGAAVNPYPILVTVPRTNVIAPSTASSTSSPITAALAAGSAGLLTWWVLRNWNRRR